MATGKAILTYHTTLACVAALRQLELSRFVYLLFDTFLLQTKKKKKVKYATAKCFDRATTVHNASTFYLVITFVFNNFFSFTDDALERAHRSEQYQPHDQHVPERKYSRRGR